MTTTSDKTSVLIVEDESLVAIGHQDKLHKLGYRVCGLAFSGSEALKLAERYAPDVILMDINLIGEMDGIDVICQLGKRSKTPVVFISAYPADMVLERLSETEPYEYLVKPLRSNALQTAVEHILDRS